MGKIRIFEAVYETNPSDSIYCARVADVIFSKQRYDRHSFLPGQGSEPRAIFEGSRL